MSAETIFHHPDGDIRFSDWADDDFGYYDYTTCDGRYSFRFNLVPAGILDSYLTSWPPDEVVIFIVEQPDYQGRDNDGHATHRNTYRDGRRYICVGRDFDPPRTVPEALTWALYWSEKTARYIDTGTSFS